jgi:hypothetical protein
MKPPLSLSLGPRCCTSCGSLEVQRSRRRNALERFILPCALLRPFRCSLCNDRHYGFYFRKRANAVTQAGSESPAHHHGINSTVS